jgi:DNA-binding beta-propeller fold protein YncE
VAVDSAANKIYVADATNNRVVMIDGATLLTSSVQVGRNVIDVAANPVTHRVYDDNNGDGTIGVIAGGTSNPPQFIPVTPCRLVDTRQSGGPIQGGTSRSFTVPQLGGCDIPSGATMYSLNVTVVPISTLGYLTIWPTGATQPYVSTMNSTDGRTKANAAIVPPGVNGAVSVYVTDTTNVILDIDGYFTTAGPQTLQFYPLPPCRVVDTRQTDFPHGLGAPSFGSMETRELPVFTNSPCLNTLTVTPAAYSFNVTAVPNPQGKSLNYLTIWPSNEPMPGVSTLNNPTATVVANAAIVQSEPSTGDVSVFTYDSTDVIIDVNGYFAPALAGYNLYPVAPCRAYDSRNNNGQPFMGERTVPIATSPCAPPGNAAAYVFNATVVPSGVMPYLTLWPDSEGQPIVSTLNAYDGFITSNMAIVPNVDGSIDAYAAGLTQLILDISGYFAQ